MIPEIFFEEFLMFIELDISQNFIRACMHSHFSIIKVLPRAPSHSRRDAFTAGNPPVDKLSGHGF
jgi:hypothetical protein